MTTKAKRIRESNFSRDEKDIIISFVAENAPVLESKATDPKIFRKKRELWETLSKKMKCAGYERTSSKLRDTYFRMKQTAKNKIQKFKKEQRKTGGGEGPSGEDCPSEIDWTIYDLCPTDFQEDISVFDSDFVESQNTSLKPTQAKPSIVSPYSPPTPVGLIDPVTGEIETIVEENNNIPVPNPSVPSNFSNRKPENIVKSRKRKREMSAYEEEMLKIQKRHIEARIENEKLINQKELEILEIKKEAEKIRLDILKTYLRDKSKVNLENLVFH